MSTNELSEHSTTGGRLKNQERAAAAAGRRCLSEAGRGGVVGGNPKIW